MTGNLLFVLSDNILSTVLVRTNLNLKCDHFSIQIKRFVALMVKFFFIRHLSELLPFVPLNITKINKENLIIVIYQKL